MDTKILHTIKDGLCSILPETECMIVEEAVPLPQKAYDATRRQYHSTTILTVLGDYVKKSRFGRVLGVADVDLYVPHLNFVFGEAQCPGGAAVISLHRLRPEFYRKPHSEEVFLERSIKEAVHEVGHTLGLGHCGNPRCVMFFSNSIFDTDRKGSALCERCRPLAMRSLRKGGVPG